MSFLLAAGLLLSPCQFAVQSGCRRAVACAMIEPGEETMCEIMAGNIVKLRRYQPPRCLATLKKIDTLSCDDFRTMIEELR